LRRAGAARSQRMMSSRKGLTDSAADTIKQDRELIERHIR
jgi:hypothetical protein